MPTFLVALTSGFSVMGIASLGLPFVWFFSQYWNGSKSLTVFIT